MLKILCVCGCGLGSSFAIGNDGEGGFKRNWKSGAN